MICLCDVLIELSSSVSPLTQATSTPQSTSTQYPLPSRIREKSKKKLTSPIKPIVIRDENDHEKDNHPNADDDEEYNELSAKKKKKNQGKSPSKTANKIILPNVISSTPTRADVSAPLDEKKIIQLINNNNKHILEESKMS